MTQGRLIWRPLFYAGVGVILGLVINPYFPQNLVFDYHHITPELLNPTEATRVGREWYLYDTGQLLGNPGGALAMAALGCQASG